MRDLSVPIATETSARTNHSRRRRTRRTQTRQHCSREGTREKRFNHSSVVLFWPSFGSIFLSWSLSFSPPPLVTLSCSFFPTNPTKKTEDIAHCAELGIVVVVVAVAVAVSVSVLTSTDKNGPTLTCSLNYSHPIYPRLLPLLSQSIRGLPSFFPP